MSATQPSAARPSATQPGATRPGVKANWAAFAALWRLSFRNAFSWWRLGLLSALGAGLVGLTALSANALRNADLEDRTVSDIDSNINTLVSFTGLGLVLPIVALLFAGSALGDLREEKSLVYVWVSPTNRLITPLAAILSSYAIVLPITTISLALCAVVADISASYVAAVTVATLLGGLAYCGLFVAASLLIRRVLGWGLGFVLIWESVISAVPGPLGQLSVRHYTSSIITDWGGIETASGVVTSTLGVSLIVLGIIVVGTVTAATVRFSKMAID